MSPVPKLSRHYTRLLYSLFSVASQYVPRLLRLSPQNGATAVGGGILLKRDSQFDPHKPASVVEAVLIPVLVLLSGVFAGLTLGYMSLDETQLNVLSISGTPKQREYANKIKPIRQNGHLLLVTLLLANMITNETLPIVADPVLGGGVQSVVVSTVLIVIFAEIIPQSLFTRYGLYLGAKMAGFTRCLIFLLGIVAWPVAKLLEFVLGAHHGIIYRRAELKELIAMHSALATHGGDLKTDTVTIIGATLDLQEKVVRQAMTPIKDVFMLSIDSYLDYDLLKQICLTGHSRVPVYEEVDLNGTKVKKILGILLVKQCVLLDPKDAIPLRKIPLNKVPFIPNNEPLLGLLDKFQEGRSHMAIVSRFGVDKAASVKQAVKRGLTQRLRDHVMGDSDSSDEEEKKEAKQAARRKKKKKKDLEEGIPEDFEGDTLGEEDHANGNGYYGNGNAPDGEKDVSAHGGRKLRETEDGASKSRRPSFQIPRAAAGMASMSALEQSMPADAVLGKAGAAEFLQNFDPAVMPLGIITLEDVLEELIGEEIYDEFDPQGAHGDPYVPPARAEVPLPPPPPPPTVEATPSSTSATGKPSSNLKPPTPVLKPLSLKGLNFLRSRSAPPTPREVTAAANVLNGPGRATESPAALPSADQMTTMTEESSTATAATHTIPTVIIEGDTPSPTTSLTPTVPDECAPAPAAAPVPELKRPVPVALGMAAAAPGLASAAASRSASPAPSLEAVLLDRKRRLGGAAPTTAPAGSAGSAAASGPKGTMFKSSPLGGGERAGVVVAERVKGQNSGGDGGGPGAHALETRGGAEEGRIPSERDKDAPDKRQ